LKEGLVGSARGYYQSVLEIQPDDQEGLKALKSIEDHQQPREVPKALSTLEVPPPKFPHPPGKKVMGEKSSLPPPPPIHETPILSDETETTSVDKDSEMHYHLGIAYKEMDLFDYAVSEFELASSNPSIKCDCYIMLGNCFMERGDYDKSIEYYKMASEIKGLSGAKLARLHFSLGLVYEASGMVSEALDSFHLVLKLDHSVSEAQEKIKKLQQK
jgi:tetratricopeptide (TPR) repeat protein